VAETAPETQWILENLGPDVPLHFTAFHPDWKMMDTPHTPAASLTRARQIALKNGLHYVYTGNVHDHKGGSTYCPNCGELLIGRDWYQLSDWNIKVGGNYTGNCTFCGTPIPGVFTGPPGNWGRKRVPVRLRAPAA
jgi:pyruvate formate lyase activating enzyme